MVSVSVEGPYSYRVPAGMAVERGSIVAVPLVGRLTLGVVWGAPKDNFAHNRLKDIAQVYDMPPLSRRTAEDRRLGEPLHAGAARAGAALGAALDRGAGAGAAGHRLPRDRARARAADAGAAAGARRAWPMAQAWAKSAIVGASGVSASVIEGLERAGALERLEIAAAADRAAARSGCGGADASAPSRRRRWRRSASSIAQKFGVALLDGVTGGGKTEVFFEAVADTLRAGRQALVLLPEIALTHTFLDRFTRRFGTRPAEWHSDMTPAQRARTWRGVLNGTVRAVVGARSALFLPFRELGLIVLDEEHDGAFKQSDGVNYHARDMAVVRAKFAEARVILSLGDAIGREPQQRQYRAATSTCC